MQNEAVLDMNSKTKARPVWALSIAALLWACGDDSTDGVGDGGELPGDGGGIACERRIGAPAAEPASCAPSDTDYVPCSDDGYAGCVSDDGEYHRIQETISSVGRVLAFEEIADLLFDPGVDPGFQDFLDARLIYQEPEGLDSRVVRRYDPHFDVPEGTDCTLEGVPQQEPDYCVGPGLLQPRLLEAFNAGIAEQAPRTQAGRIEGGLLWFLYVSTAKESLTCTDTAKDCDSAYAYYTGGEPARGGLGLARYLADADPYAHDRVWDGILAVRCWRDLDDGESASDTELRDRARAQMDRALLDGIAAVLDARLDEVATTSDDEQAYHAAFVRALAPALDREARERDASMADALAAALAGDDPTTIDVNAAQSALAALFDCP